METELKTNAKHLSPEEQFVLRKGIIRLSKQGKKVREIAELLDVSERHVKATRASYKKDGFAGIKQKQRGRKPGEKRTLTSEQETEIRKSIVDKNPEQLKLKGCMWTRKNIAELIAQRYGLSMPLSTLGYYLERWGFSVQRPVKKAYKQNPEQIDRWLHETYPSIVERAKAENAEIYWGDETGVQNTADYLRGYAPVGQTPVIRVEAQKLKANLLSAISGRGKLRFMVYEKLTPETLIDFMGRLVRDSARKVFLILDNLRIHHARTVSEWLRKNKDRIEVFFLPPYAPEYNPDEFLNSDLKRDIGNRPMPRSVDEIVRNVLSYMEALSGNVEKVITFFMAPSVRYAAIRGNL